MTDFIAGLMSHSYPAIIIERWTANDGWPCFKVFIATRGRAVHRIQVDEDFDHFAQAHAAAVDYAAQHLPTVIPIIDMTEGQG